jgi:tRNA threonylcarbamoyladenosine biosynthesis protein TsaE
MSTALESHLPARTDSAAATVALGARLAAALEPGDVVALYGDLGAGKTHLAKGICEGLGIDPMSVTSPTFTIVQEYAGRLPVYHVDAYRINRIEEFFELGYDSFFFGEGVTLIEWPERVEPLIPAGAIRLRLAHAGGDGRTVERDAGAAQAGTRDSDAA